MGTEPLNRVRQVAVLGSTGSIGCSTLDVLSRLSDRFQIGLLSCHQNLPRFQQQCADHRPAHAVITGTVEGPMRDWLKSTDAHTQRSHGMDRVVDVIRSSAIDIVVAAIVGIAGLESSLAAAESGKRLALANKEALVVAGQLMLNAVKASQAELIPIDSEHSAIFQALQAGHRSDEVERIILTASGGPLRHWPIDELEQATVDDALAHPTWHMGRKITVDSATMMNKALEVIEARWLFDIEPKRIQVVVHPQSIIHSMVEFHDGSVIAQMSPPDMRLPIQYALTYPDRLPSPSRRMDWSSSSELDWYPVDFARYPALKLGFEVAERGGTCGAVLNAANEAAVTLFLDRKMRLTDIADVCRAVLENHHYSPTPNLSELLLLDQWARDEVYRWMKISC